MNLMLRKPPAKFLENGIFGVCPAQGWRIQ
jgi:hypothetical protein